MKKNTTKKGLKKLQMPAMSMTCRKPSNCH